MRIAIHNWFTRDAEGPAHDPKNGQFTAGSGTQTHPAAGHGQSEIKPGTKLQHFEVHHNGEHLGNVKNYRTSSYQKPNGKYVTGKETVRWSAEPKQKEGTGYRRSSNGHRNKQDAIEHLTRSYGK